MRPLLALALVALLGCTSDEPAAAPTTTTTTSTASTTTIAPTTTTSTTAPPAFTSTVEPVTSLGASWHDGCPVPVADLRLVTLTVVGFDGLPHDGRLVVHADVADAVVQAFHELFDAGFPIERMEPVDAYDGDDDRSMAANNTSAFNCRPVAGSSRWSEHAYGRAIDINPIQNPYVHGDAVDPPAGAAYVDRNAATPGLITADGPVVAAFARLGWGWGGSWRSGKDYQHVSASGR